MLKPKSKTEKKQAAKTAKKLSFGLRTKIILGITLPLIIILNILGFVLRTQVSDVVESLKMKEIDAQTTAAAQQADTYFRPFFTTSRVVGDMNCVRELLSQAQAGGKSFRFENSEIFHEVLAEMTDAASNKDVGLQSVWLGGVANSQLGASDGSYSDASFVISDRPWYKLVEAAGPENVILTGAYEDYTSGSLVVTAASGVYSGNRLIGIVGMDIMLDTLIQDFKSITIGDTGYLTIYDSDGYVLYHPNSDLVMKHISELGYTDNMLSALNSRKTTDAMEYERSGTPYCGSTEYIDSIGWQVLGCMPESEFHQEVNATNAILMTGFAVCAVILAAISFILATAVVIPVKKLQQVTGELAKGNLDVEIHSTSKDEIGQLADNTAQVVDRLKTYILYINEVSDVLDEIGNGNLVFQLQQDYVGEFNRLKVALGEIQQSLSTSMFQIVDSAAQVNSGAMQIANASQALAQGTTEQASTVEELSATVQTLSTASISESERAINLSKGVAQLGNELAHSNAQMQEMLGAMNNITTQSTEIQKIIKTIDDIAFQTNILALNAAVEAARAGSAGKGFAVVADEVRNLAGKSGEAAKSIADLINTTILAVNQGSGIANDTASSLSEVARNVTKVVTAMEEFSTRYQEQTISLSQIADGIDQISAVVQTNSATAEEAAASSQELSSQARLMKEMTEQFQMDDRFHI